MTIEINKNEKSILWDLLSDRIERLQNYLDDEPSEELDYLIELLDKIKKSSPQ